MRASIWTVVIVADSSNSFTLPDVHVKCLFEVMWDTLFRSYLGEQIRHVS